MEAQAGYVTTPTIDAEIKIECQWEKNMIKKARRLRQGRKPAILCVQFHEDGRVSYFPALPDGMVLP